MTELSILRWWWVYATSALHAGLRDLWCGSQCEVLFGEPSYCQVRPVASLSSPDWTVARKPHGPAFVNTWGSKGITNRHLASVSGIVNCVEVSIGCLGMVAGMADSGS